MEDYLSNIESIIGVSFAGNPYNNTAMYLGKKLEHLIENLSGVSGCLIFFETGIEVPSEVLSHNSCIFTSHPVRDYAQVASVLWKREQKELATLTYQNKNGVIIGSGSDIAPDAIVEPGAFIDHHVSVKPGTRILTGAVIRHGTVVGKNCLIKEGAVVGCEGFTMAHDIDDKPFRLHCLAGVVLDDEVEVGSNATVCRGQSRNTHLEQYVKVDDHAYLAHDVWLQERVTVCAGVTLGGFVEIGCGSYLGMNATIKQLLKVGSNTTVGMGSVVTKDVEDGVVVYGSPARCKSE